MPQPISRFRALANALFVLVVLGLAGFGLVRVAGRHWQWQETFHARAEFAGVGGLEVGGRVRVQGIDAGVVESIVPPDAPGKSVALVLRIDERLHPLVRSDATAHIATQGLVGSKVVEIEPGRPDAPPLADGGTLRAAEPVEVADLIRDASGTLRRVDDLAGAARDGLAEINVIATGIRKGEGSLGKLVRDEEAYRKLVALSERGQRTLADVDENLAALKRTWPLSRYFNDRNFFDRQRVLYKPGAERDSRVVPEADLFEPGRAVLTAQGRGRLDRIADWFKAVRRPKSEVVIAAFTAAIPDAEMAQILTQEQAEAVRTYLVTQHKIDARGWFGSRKVAAVGFGTEAPPGPGPGPPADLPPRRVEIICFTPQA